MSGKRRGKSTRRSLLGLLSGPCAVAVDISGVGRLERTNEVRHRWEKEIKEIADRDIGRGVSRMGFGAVGGIVRIGSGFGP